MKKPDIILVDDHKIFRQGLKSIITIENIATVIGEASNGMEFINLLNYLQPDLVLMDIDMPEMNGLEATQRAIEIVPDIKILAFTMFGDQEYIQKMEEIGASGYIQKSSDISELEKAMYSILKGEKYYSKLECKRNNKTIAKNIKTTSVMHPKNDKKNIDTFPPWF